MILKNKDPKNTAIKQLKDLLLLDLTAKQKNLIEKEIESTLKGDSGEKDAAYFIDFYYKDSKNWVVIHDLRIEHNGLVAQIDHLLINKVLGFFILESKSYRYGVQINDLGEFEGIGKDRNYGIDSPIEQNKRHIHLLNLFLTENNLLPKRLGMTITPNYFNYILVAPSAVIKRPKKSQFNTDNVIKSDTLKAEIEKFIDQKITYLSSFMVLPKVLSSKSIEQLGQKIVANHKSSNINYSKKFGIFTQKIDRVLNLDKDIKPSQYYCAKCKVKIQNNVAKYCWNNKDKFDGKAYCYACQKSSTLNG